MVPNSITVLTVTELHTEKGDDVARDMWSIWIQYPVSKEND